ncbi:MAG TPA: nitroreductase family protein [Solirubrobacteraceae bacterium]|nr:nitroreductase family protein [Solirubrobacteraceae bacterium]
MELQLVIRGAGTCRYFKSAPVDDATLVKLFEAARFAPQGGNRQPVRWIAIRDPEVKRQLRDWYLVPWKAYMARTRTGEIRVEGQRAQRMVEDSDHMAEHLDELPVLLVACAVMADISAVDAQLPRAGLVAGASVYPAVQNLLLTAREIGLGAALTTLLVAEEARIRELLGIPEGVAVAAIIALGWPERELPTRLTRRPVAEIAFTERWGGPPPDAGSAV